MQQPAPRISDAPAPCTVIQARYQGEYEGGLWLAFHAQFDQLHPDIFGGDAVCRRWWMDHWDDPIGRGDTPDNAVLDLIRRMRAGPVRRRGGGQGGMMF